MVYPQILSLFYLSLVEIIGDFSLKEYANNTLAYPALITGILSYIGVVYFLIVSLKGSTVLYVNGMWDGISALLESICAYVFLGERFKKTHQYIGLLFIIFGIILVK
jgi:multidrug transporter EmrE-like cation transporter